MLQLAGRDLSCLQALEEPLVHRPPLFTTHTLVLTPGNDQLCAAGASLPSTYVGVVNSSGAAASLQDCAPLTQRCCSSASASS